MAVDTLSTHERLVREIVSRYGAHRRGLMRAIWEAFGEDAREDIEPIGVIPDAFVIHQEEKTVVLFEVEVSYPTPCTKLARYGNFWWVVDGWEWDLVIVIIDRFGNVMRAIDAKDLASGPFIAAFEVRIAENRESSC